MGLDLGAHRPDLLRGQLGRKDGDLELGLHLAPGQQLEPSAPGLRAEPDRAVEHPALVCRDQPSYHDGVAVPEHDLRPVEALEQHRVRGLLFEPHVVLPLGISHTHRQRLGASRRGDRPAPA